MQKFGWNRGNQIQIWYQRQQTSTNINWCPILHGIQVFMKEKHWSKWDLWVVNGLLDHREMLKMQLKIDWRIFCLKLCSSSMFFWYENSTDDWVLKFNSVYICFCNPKCICWYDSFQVMLMTHVSFLFENI